MVIILLIVVLIGMIMLALIVVDARGAILRQLGLRLLILLVLIGVALYAFRYSLTRAIDCLPNCTGVNFVGRDLQERDFNNVNFVEAQMTRVNLSFANLANSDLSGAVINNADLKNANLNSAFLIGANLVNTDFTGADLTNASLLGANLTGSNLSGIDLSQTEMQGATLDEASLVDVDLSGNFLAGLGMRDADLSGANLSGANLAGATLSGANLSGTDLSGADLAGAFLNLATLTGADLTGANLSGASLVGSNISSVVLQDASLVGALIMGADFDGADLRGANFSYVRGIGQVTEQDLLLDEKIFNLNSLQRSELFRSSSIAGVIVDETTLVDEDLLPVPIEEDEGVVEGGIPVGILYSVSGDLSFSESAILDATLLAIEEINANGGVLGMPILPFVEDGASNADVFVDKAEKLLEVDEVKAIFGTWTSQSRRAVRPLLTESNGLLFYPAQYEGLEQSSNIIYMGADPSQQVIPAIEYLIKQGYKKFYLIGTDVVYPRTINSIVKAQLTQSDATVVGESLLPFGTTDLEFATREIEFLAPSVVLSTLVGGSANAFFTKLQEEQMAASLLPVVSFNLAEQEIQAFGSDKLVGHLVVSSYYQTIDTVTNFSFVESYKEAYGRDSVTSAAVEAGYTSVYLWKALAEVANSVEVDDVLEAARTADVIVDAPGGPLRLDPETLHAYKVARVGQVRNDGQIIELFSSPDPIPPDPFLTNYRWAQELVLRLLEENQ